MVFLLFCVQGNNAGNGGGVSVQCLAPIEVRQINPEKACADLGNAMLANAANARIYYKSAKCININPPAATKKRAAR